MNNWPQLTKNEIGACFVAVGHGLASRMKNTVIAVSGMASQMGEKYV